MDHFAWAVNPNNGKNLNEISGWGNVLKNLVENDSAVLEKLIKSLQCNSVISLISPFRVGCSSSFEQIGLKKTQQVVLKLFYFIPLEWNISHSLFEHVPSRIYKYPLINLVQPFGPV